MSNVSYEVKLNVSADKRDKAAEITKELRDKWQSGPGDFDFEDMTLDFDAAAGVFEFDTAGIVGISPALMDDTTLILKDLGRLGEKGAMVYHVYNGEKSNFAIGPSKEALQMAIESSEITQAREHLEKALAVAPRSIAPDIEKVIRTLKDME